MSNFQNKVRAEYTQGSWAFVDQTNPSVRVRFDQALIDATLITHHRIEGYVKSVHGIDGEIAQYLDSRVKGELGIAGVHRLGRVGTLHRLRLLEDGTVEKVGAL